MKVCPTCGAHPIDEIVPRSVMDHRVSQLVDQIKLNNAEIASLRRFIAANHPELTAHLKGH